MNLSEAQLAFCKHVGIPINSFDGYIAYDMLSEEARTYDGPLPNRVKAALDMMTSWFDTGIKEDLEGAYLYDGLKTWVAIHRRPYLWVHLLAWELKKKGSA